MKVLNVAIGLLWTCANASTGTPTGALRGTSFEQESLRTANVDQLCFKHPAPQGYNIRHYILRQKGNDGCTKKLSDAGQCYMLSEFTHGDCFQRGATFQVQVDIQAGWDVYLPKDSFTYIPFSNTVHITMGGTVDFASVDYKVEKSPQPENAYELMQKLSLDCCKPDEPFCEDESNSCEFGKARCVRCETKPYWEEIGSGISETVTKEINWSNTGSKTTSKTTTKTISGSFGIGFKGVSTSISFSNQVSKTVGHTFSETHGGSIGISWEVDCKDGRAYAWYVDVTQSFPGLSSSTTHVPAPNAVCVPASTPKGPQCPKDYCYDVTSTGDYPGCQCCNSADWTSDPIVGKQSLCK